LWERVWRDGVKLEAADPVVIVGTYNWTMAGAYDNDENALILHDRELARAYYAEWQRPWATVPVERALMADLGWIRVFARKCDFCPIQTASLVVCYQHRVRPAVTPACGSD
jgi:phosphatidylserine/phosphatidylglycerophosphate/cardiolipin synthase-like enzyme